MYEYAAELERVVDGDTLDLKIDLGFKTYIRERVRIHGINAPEHNTEAGQHAIAFVEDWFTKNKGPILIKTTKDKREKYGRMLAAVWIKDRSLAVDLINAGHALAWDGKGVRPVGQ